MALAVAAEPVTQAVARYACGADLSSAPDVLFDRATRAFIDTIAVAIAGRNEPSFSLLAETIGTRPDGVATVLPLRTLLSASEAALLNGTAGHALDYDDVADQINGHPSVVLVPALLALAEAHQSSGRELLEAYVVGFEVACAIAAGLPVKPHYRKGWHATATIGILGAAAGAARLLGLSESEACNALGIAGSMAGGSRQNFGTMTKPLHAGLVARDAVLAAELAARGFTADEQMLEGPIGYFALYGVDPDLARVTEALRNPRVLLEHGLNVKNYPCCYNTHRMADAALALHSRGVRATEIRSVAVMAEAGSIQAIIHHRPQTGLQGKFSGEYVVAACLLDGAVRLSTFEDSAVTRAEAQELLRRVTISEWPEPYTTVEVILTDGTALTERCDVPRGHASRPLTDAELEAKFRDCLHFSGSNWDADRLLASLGDMRSAPRVSELFS